MDGWMTKNAFQIVRSIYTHTYIHTCIILASRGRKTTPLYPLWWMTRNVILVHVQIEHLLLLKTRFTLDCK